MLIRLYLHDFEKGVAVWSVDEGDKSTEKRFIDVTLIDITGTTKFNLQADNKDEPKCWIELDGELIESDGDALIRGRGSI